MTRLTASGRHTLGWYEQRVNYIPQTLGINYPWMNNHANGSVTNYLGSQYDSTMVENDLALIASLGITTIRAWAPLETIMSWSGSAYSFNSTYKGNLDDFLIRCNNHGLQVILVIGDGKSTGGYSDLDGKFRWTFVTSSSAYLTALSSYVSYFLAHTNILMWELQNEPYGNLTWSDNAIASGVTQLQTHSFLVSCYSAVKALVGNAYVGFSDYEEEQQARYQLFSSGTNRATLVDDCTDVYSMHIYRQDYSQLADFRALSGKPKWCSEIGSYNYDDPTGVAHSGQSGYNELINDGPVGFSGISNDASVRSIAANLINAGFSLILPWAVGDNTGMVLHMPDGSHIVKSLPTWMKGRFTTTRLTASGRHAA